MPTEVLVPKLGMTMKEGTVAEWYVPDGAEVTQGQRVYRLETEKIEFQVEAETSGTVRHLVPAGTKLPPGTIVGYILAAGEAMPEGVAPLAARAPAGAAPATAALARSPGERIFASPIARRLAREVNIALHTIAGSGPWGRIIEADVLRAKAAPRPVAANDGAAAGADARKDILASPLARNRAKALNVDLRHVRGSGPGGRITVEDVDAAAAAPTVAPRPQPGAAAATPAHRLGEAIPIRGMRKTIATRMHASLQEMAQLTMGMDVEIDEATKLRAQLIEEWAPEGIRPSYTDLVIKAVAKALVRHPLLNARLGDEAIELEPEVHIGMAVALDDGLVVPVIRNADVLPLKDIAGQSTRLAAAARSGALGLDDMAGQTFSVTALGSAGVGFFTPIINPPNVAILGIGSIRDAVAWEGDRPVRRQALTLSLTIDHRAVDGAPGAAFLGNVRDLLQSPYRLLV